MAGASHPAAGRFRRALRALDSGTALAVLIPPVIALGVYTWAGHHKLLPGMRGCGYVRDSGAQLECYRAQLRALAKEKGTKAALKQIDRDSRSDAQLAQNCHLAWHPVGEREGRRARRDGETIKPPRETSFCQQGYVHGYYIGYFGKTPPGASGARVAEQICLAESGKDEVRNCFHSFGHVFAQQASTARKAARACAEIELPSRRKDLAVEEARFQCGYGLYMEVALRELNSGGHAKPNNCDDAPRAVADACAAFLPARVESLTGDQKASALTCRKYVAPGAARDRCIVSYAIGVSGKHACRYYEVRSERALCEARVR